MTLVDVNVLVYVSNRDSPNHERTRVWWETVLQSGELIALPCLVIAGFVRVVTNRSTSRDPLTPTEALSVGDEWLALPNVRVVGEAAEFWTLFKQLITEAGRAGNLVTDAHLAAIAIGNGAKLASCDTDFARFSKLRWINPLVA